MGFVLTLRFLSGLLFSAVKKFFYRREQEKKEGSQSKFKPQTPYLIPHPLILQVSKASSF